MITPHTAGNVHPESAVKKILRNYRAIKNGAAEALDFEFVLRQLLPQVGTYAPNYTHMERFVNWVIH